MKHSSGWAFSIMPNMREPTLPPTPRKDAVLAIRLERMVESVDVKLMESAAIEWMRGCNAGQGLQAVSCVDVHAISARQIDIEAYGEVLTSEMLQGLASAATICLQSSAMPLQSLEFV